MVQILLPLLTPATQILAGIAIYSLLNFRYLSPLLNLKTLLLRKSSNPRNPHKS